MSEKHVTRPATDVSFCSSLKEDSWHDLSGRNAFESWHFDAVSDDGREALVITFYDNYVLSPRFQARSGRSDTNGSELSEKTRFPSVSLVYSIDGKTVLSSVNEYGPADFHARPGISETKLGGSSFRADKAEYGAGFFVTVDIRTVRGRRIRAELEWLSIEADLLPKGDDLTGSVWNMAVPRADVSGKIMLIGRRGKLRKLIHFRGTGYHDHISSENVHFRELSSRMWGRAHFVDSTVVFNRNGGDRDNAAAGQFFLIRNGEIHERDAACVASEPRRDRWGLVIPRRLLFTSADNIKLRGQTGQHDRIGVIRSENAK